MFGLRKGCGFISGNTYPLSAQVITLDAENGKHFRSIGFQHSGFEASCK